MKLADPVAVAQRMRKAEPRAPLLSALVVARDVERRLPSCLDRLRFCDEIVVVLDRTTDGSAAVARRFGARVIEGAWAVEGERRNAGIAACRGDWVLEIDADEHVPAALAHEVLATIAASRDDHHLVPIDNFIGSRLVRHGWGASFGVAAKEILFRRGNKRWHHQRVHPRVTLDGRQGPRLATPLEHHVDRNISDMLERFDRYTSARAQDLRAGDLPPETLRRNLRRVLTRFWKCYVTRKGYREGGWGLLVAILASLFPLVAHLKATLEDEDERPRLEP